MMLDEYNLDFISVVWFLVAWVGYACFARARARHVRCLLNMQHEYMLRWMVSLINRENRISDATLFAIMERNVTFFASTSMLILVGLISSLVSLDDISIVLGRVSFLKVYGLGLLSIKVLLLVIIYIYAFFTFTWSMRQYNVVIMMTGGAPLFGESESKRMDYAQNAGNVLSLAANSFNYGLRAYYFSLATLAWFIHPVMFMFSTIWVVLVLYRREFYSKTLQAMSRL
ncbi:MAG: DUF599 domain-containing protein [Methylobacter sp.]|jgi:uncharacterized membrane protein